MQLTRLQISRLTSILAKMRRYRVFSPIDMLLIEWIIQQQEAAYEGPHPST